MWLLHIYTNRHTHRTHDIKASQLNEKRTPNLNNKIELYAIGSCVFVCVLWTEPKQILNTQNKKKTTRKIYIFIYSSPFCYSSYFCPKKIKKYGNGNEYEFVLSRRWQKHQQQQPTQEFAVSSKSFLDVCVPDAHEGFLHLSTKLYFTVKLLAVAEKMNVFFRRSHAKLMPNNFMAEKWNQKKFSNSPILSAGSHKNRINYR